MDSKIRYEIEFPINSSPQLLYQYISTPSGLSEWFADNVNSRGEFFTFIWNDYFWATVLIQGNHAMPVIGGLKSLNGQWVAQWQLVSAGSLLAAAPPIVLFFLMQKQFVEGLTLGASKG